jgi:polar amino acid transport system permease protein
MLDLFLANFFNLGSLLQIYPLLLQGLELTAIVAAVTLPLAIAAGLAIGILYSFHLRPLNLALLVYIDLFRSFPVVVLLILIFYGLPFLGIELGRSPRSCWPWP